MNSIESIEKPTYFNKGRDVSKKSDNNNFKSYYGGKVFGVKRNIKKTASSQTEPIAEMPNLFRSEGLSRYKYPNYDEVPAGYYFSKIEKVKPVTTKAGKPAYEVYYLLREGVTCYNIIKGNLPVDTDIKTYYIKQSYPMDTQYFFDFIDAMAVALDIGNKEFFIDDIVGVEEYVTLEYGRSDIGGFTKREPFEFEAYLQEANEAEYVETDVDDDYLDDID